MGPTTPCHLGDTTPPQEAGRHAPVQCSCCVRQQEQVLLTGSSSSVLCKSKQTKPAEAKSDLAQFGIGGKERGEDVVLTVGVGLGRRGAMVRLPGAAAFGTSGQHGVGGSGAASHRPPRLQSGWHGVGGGRAGGGGATSHWPPRLQTARLTASRSWNLHCGGCEADRQAVEAAVKCCPSQMGRSEGKLVSGALTCAIVRI
jgi:hypothetical protein